MSSTLTIVLSSASAVLVVGISGWVVFQSELRKRWVLVSFLLLAVLPVLHWALSAAGVPLERWLRFERSWLALPLALVAIAAAWVLLRSAPQAPLRRALVEASLMGALLSAGLAAVGLELGQSIDRMAVILAVDRSKSAELVPQMESRIDAELRLAAMSMKPEDRLGVVAFGADAVVEDPLRPKAKRLRAQRAVVASDGTNIEAAIRRALVEVPPDYAARIVVISDGIANRGDAQAAAAAASAADVAIDAVPLEPAPTEDVAVLDVRASSNAHKGEAIDLRVVTRASRAGRVRVRVRRNGELIREGELAVAEGEDVVRLREVAPDPGLYRYDVEVAGVADGQDELWSNNLESQYVRVRGAARALIMDREPELALALQDALSAAAIEADVVGLGRLPTGLAQLAAYDLVVIGELAARHFAPSQLEALASYVRDLGGGLILLGGEESMGPGGYGKTPVEEVSPVSFDLKQDRRRASLAEIIAIDYSGSMGMSVGAKTKLELANEAAARSAELLGRGDRLGVMHVDTQVSWTVPLGPVKDKQAIVERIREVGPGGGGIFVDLTLDQSYAALLKEKVNLKHLLLFADGSDAENRTRAFSLVRGAKRRGITTSIVALGEGPDVPDLERMSRLGDGRFYLIEDASRLPAVFAQETIIASRSALNEVTFKPSVGTPGSPVRGIDWTQAPALTGYVITLPKARTEVYLRAVEGDPLLASWSAGIGRAAAFTSDYRDRWGAQWTGWAGASRMFGQLARNTARRGEDANVKLDARAEGGELKVMATVVKDDGRAQSFRRLAANVVGPDGKSVKIPLEGVGAGAYSASLPVMQPGEYMVSAVDEAEGSMLATAGAMLSAGEELRVIGSDRALLRSIAQGTGGKLRETLAGLFLDRAPRRMAWQPLTNPLVIIAASLLLASVAARRLSLPRLPTERVRAWRQARAARRPQIATKKPEAGSLNALVQRRARRAAPARERGDLAGKPLDASHGEPSVSADVAASGEGGRSAASLEATAQPRAGESRSIAPRRQVARKPSRAAVEVLLERRRRRG